MGDFANGQMKQPRFSKSINGNRDVFLNVDCTMAYLFGKPEAMKIVEPFLNQGSGELQEQAERLDGTSMLEAMKTMTLRQVLSYAVSYAGMPKELIDQIDGQLRQIPNK